jgi:hypothetical protein
VSGAGAEKTITLGETRTVAVDRHQTAAVTPEDTQTAGQIKTTRADKDEFGRFTNTTETRLAAAVADAEVTKEVRDDETIVRDLDRNQAAAGTPPASHTDGQIDAVTSRKNEFGKFDVETVVRTRADQSITGALVEKTPTFSSLGDVIDGQTAVPTALGEDDYGILDYRKDEFGRYVGRRIIRTYNDTFTIPGWTIGSVGSYTLTGERRYMQKKNGTWVYKVITYMIALYQRSSNSAAMGDISGGLASSPAGGSRIVALANGQYLSIKVTSDEATANWTTDSGLQ